MTTPTIHVVATTRGGTEAALKAAVPLARRHDARVVLLVLRMPGDAEESPWTDRALIAGYEEMAMGLGRPVQIRLCMTPTPSDAAAYLIPNGATVVVGGPVRPWWPTAEQRLAARLRRSGRVVVFVGCDSRRPRRQTGVPSHA